MGKKPLRRLCPEYRTPVWTSSRLQRVLIKHSSARNVNLERPKLIVQLNRVLYLTVRVRRHDRNRNAATRPRSVAYMHADFPLHEANHNPDTSPAFLGTLPGCAAYCTCPLASHTVPQRAFQVPSRVNSFPPLRWPAKPVIGALAFF